MECYECTSLPDVSKGDECDSDRLITCPKSYDRCMTMKYTMSVKQADPVSVERRRCSNSALCDQKNLLNSKSRTRLLINSTNAETFYPTGEAFQICFTSSRLASPHVNSPHLALPWFT